MSAPIIERLESRTLLASVADTTFDHDRGLYYDSFQLTISSATLDAQIRYTLDGSAPTASTGLLYTAPIPITTTILRAAAFKPGYLPTNVDTQTYIFPLDVPHQPANPPGFPASWASIPADYEMDPYVVNHPSYSDEMLTDHRRRQSPRDQHPLDRRHRPARPRRPQPHPALR